MKAISLWSPWAQLIEHGYKAIETRSWPTRHRGPLAICSTRTWSEAMADHAAALLCDWDVTTSYPAAVQRFNGSDIARIKGRYQLGDRIVDKDCALPLGCCLCVADLWGCLPVEQVDGLSDQERAMGNYSPGRFAWILKDVRRVAVPFFVTGKQGLWELDDARHARELGLAA